MYIRGIFVFLAGIIFIGALSSNFDYEILVSTFYDMPTTFMLLITIIAVIMTTGNFKTFIMSINALLSRKYRIASTDRDHAIELFKLISKSVIGVSLLCVVMGFMLMLRNLSDPSALGPTISVALNSLFQGMLVNLIFIYPAIHVLKNRRNVEEIPVISEKQVIDKMLELCYRQGILPEDILNADEISFKRYQ